MGAVPSRGRPRRAHVSRVGAPIATSRTRSPTSGVRPAATNSSAADELVSTTAVPAATAASRAGVTTSPRPSSAAPSSSRLPACAGYGTVR
ncbi:hypothetical protein L597_003300000080 [Micrococcus luteus J28]|nr:hypothetical protein L597_003300000080 [Micrococcus luteus J28]